MASYAERTHLVFHLNEKQARLLGNAPLDPLKLKSLTTSALSRSFWLPVLLENVPTTSFPRLFHSSFLPANAYSCLGGYRANILASICRNEKEESEWEGSENAEGPFSKGFFLLTWSAPRLDIQTPQSRYVSRQEPGGIPSCWPS